MKKLFFILVLFGIGQIANSQTLKENASKAYQDENYTEAITLWDSIIQEQGISPEALYNKGNAYYKTGNYAKAILNYEKALLLSPEDEDIQHNIEVVEAQLKDQIEAIPELFFINWLNKLNMWISGTAWGILSIIFFCAFLGIMLWRLFRRSNSGNRMILYLAAFIFLISATSLILAMRSNSIMEGSGEAIVMKDVLVKSSPSETGTNLFEIHEGLKVQIQDSVNGYSEIRLSDGKKGWINSEMIEEI